MDYRPIGFFDSGVGGLSVLKEAIRQMPNEDYIYFGDSKNAPYGTRNVDEVKQLSFDAVDFLIKKDVKAVVVACNTATSAAIDDLRGFYSNMPVIGIEPALKPAVELRRKGRIIIMATPMTLAETKFSNLMKNYSSEAEIEPMPCAGLVEFIEQGILEGNELRAYLTQKLRAYLHGNIAAVVLGCTHYPFVRNELKNILGEKIPVIDGSEGTVKQLKRQLQKIDGINDGREKGKLSIYNSDSSEKLIKLSYKLLEY